MSKASASRIESASAATRSSAMSASTRVISGWSISALPKAARWRTWCTASAKPPRISPALATAQSSRVSVTISRIVATPRPSSPTRQAPAPSNSTSAEALERLPSLSFSRSSRIALTRAVGKEARHQEAGEPALRLRQHQEGVRHRRGEEPFVPGDAIDAVRRSGSARVVLARTSVPPCFSVIPMPSVTPRFSAAGRRLRS